VRKELTNEWEVRGVKKGMEYAILTDEITQAWSNMTTRQYKNLKRLKKENLRDNMSTLGTGIKRRLLSFKIKELRNYGYGIISADQITVCYRLLLSQLIV
jgi:hypothetical protein